MTNTKLHKETLDGITFVGRVPYKESNREGVGKLVALEDIYALHEAMVRELVALGMQGPETFRFLRKFCKLPMVRLAELIDVDRTTVHRWEAGDVPIPRAAFAAVMTMAAQQTKAKVDPQAVLTRLADPKKAPRKIDVTAVAV